MTWAAGRMIFLPSCLWGRSRINMPGKTVLGCAVCPGTHLQRLLFWQRVHRFALGSRIPHVRRKRPLRSGREEAEGEAEGAVVGTGGLCDTALQSGGLPRGPLRSIRLTRNGFVLSSGHKAHGREGLPCGAAQQYDVGVARRICPSLVRLLRAWAWAGVSHKGTRVGWCVHPVQVQEHCQVK